MADKASLENLLKDKLAQLEIANPNLSEDVKQKERVALKDEMKEVEEIAKATDKSWAEKSKAIYEYLKALYDKDMNMEINLKQINKRLTDIQCDRDRAIAEGNRYVKEKLKYEASCREFQGQNKEIPDIIKRTVENEEKQREEIRMNFEKGVNDLKAKVSGEGNEAELAKKNEELKAKLQGVIDENKKKSEEIEKRIKEKQKSSDDVQERLKTMMQSRMETLMSESAKEKQTQISLMQKDNEISAQIQMYADNFGQLESSIRKSGSIFGKLRKEIKNKTEMLKTVENQKSELLKIKDSLDTEIIELTDRLKEISDEKENMKEECQQLQNKLKI